MVKTDSIKRYASDAGFALCGVARARMLGERSEHAAGLTLDYMVRSFARRLDPSSVLKGARTVVVCALEYDGSAARDGVAAFARLDEDYHVKIKRMLNEMLERARLESPGVRGKVCCDTSAILEKAWAVEAGLGWQGRNTLLIDPTRGSFLLLGEIVLDVEADSYDRPFAGKGCGTCRACVEACPVGALTDRGVDTTRCISALTIETARLDGTAPEPLHGWIHGCDQCQRACPYNGPKKYM